MNSGNEGYICMNAKAEIGKTYTPLELFRSNRRVYSNVLDIRYRIDNICNLIQYKTIICYKVEINELDDVTVVREIGLDNFRQLCTGCYMTPDGTKIWYAGGLLHRYSGPAVIRTYGNLEWYIDGDQHREDGPAMISSAGTTYWIQNDQFHRTDGPAIVYANGSEHWYINNMMVEPQ